MSGLMQQGTAGVVSFVGPQGKPTYTKPPGHEQLAKVDMEADCPQLSAISDA